MSTVRTGHAARALPLLGLTPARHCLALLLSLPLIAAAEDAPAPIEPTPLPTIVVVGEQQPTYTVDETAATTRLPLSLRETPQSVTVITRERIEDQNLQSLRDVLDNTTGVYSFAYDTERVLFSARGFTIDSTLYDGVPAAADGDTGSINANLDTAFYQRIEVVRGATGLLSGAGSPAAAINLVRKRADSKTFTGSASFSAGSWNDYRTVGDVSLPLTADGRVRARVVGVYQDSESYMDLYRNERQALYGVIDADLTSHTSLSIGYDVLRTLPQGNTWGSFPLFHSDGAPTQWRRSVTTSTDWTYWNKRTQTAFANLEQRFDNGWAIRGSFTHRQNDADMALFYLYGFPDKTTGEGLIGYDYVSDDHGQQNAFDLYANGPFQLFGRQHELVMGYLNSNRHFRVRLFNNDELTDIGNFNEWDGSYPQPVFSTVGTPISRITTRESSLYSALRLSLADPLTLIVGARYNHWDTDHYSVYDLNGVPFEYTHEVVTPYAGLVYDFAEQYSAFVSYTEIFKPQNNQGADARFLDPITGKSHEIGVKAEYFDGRLNAALTLFDTRQNNVATALTGEFLDEEKTQQIYIGVDGAQTRGFELEFAGEPLPNWNLSLGWSHYKLEGGNGEEVNPYLPRSMVRLFNTWHANGGAWSKLTVGGGANWQSKSHVQAEHPTNADRLATIEQRDLLLLNLMARYQFTPSLSAQLNAENLSDRKYYVLDEYGNLYYGPPSNATLSIHYRF